MANTSKTAIQARAAGLPMLIRTTHGRAVITAAHSDEFQCTVYTVTIHSAGYEAEWTIFDKALEDAFRQLTLMRRGRQPVKPNPFGDESEDDFRFSS